MKISKENLLFKILDNKVLRKIAHEACVNPLVDAMQENKLYDALGFTERQKEKIEQDKNRGLETLFSKEVHYMCTQVQHQYDNNNLNYFALSKSVVKLSSTTTFEKCIDESGYWKNQIENPLHGVIVYENFIMYFGYTKNYISAVIFDSMKMDNINAFSISKNGVKTDWNAIDSKDNPLGDLLKSILFMIFADHEIIEKIAITPTYKKRHKTSTGEKYVNNSDVKFTVIDSSWNKTTSTKNIIVTPHLQGYWYGQKDSVDRKLVLKYKNSYTKSYYSIATKDKV